MGKRTYEYIRSFLTGRTAEIVAGDLATDAKENGSRRTPQGSVISPLLFNLVMIEVASRLAEVEHVGHTIYADDITLWVEGGSDARVEEALQRAVRTVEDSLEGTGLGCSPSKSELLLYRPKEGLRTKKRSDREEISVYTNDGTVIPRVADSGKSRNFGRRRFRILGMLIY